MYKSNKIIAIIPARGGSKGIPNKNIINVLGRPLIDYTIKEALKSEYIDDIIVSTDSDKIAKIAKNSGAEIPFLRSEHLAQDTTNTIDVLVDTIEKLKDSGRTYDYMLLLQPTQPLRRVFHIDNSIKEIIDNNRISLVSVNKVKDHPILFRKIDSKGNLSNLLNENSTLRRQDFTEYYKVNGAIYINKLDSQFDSNTSLNDNRFAYIMDSSFDVDIDEPMDIEIFKTKWLFMNLND